MNESTTPKKISQYLLNVMIVTTLAIFLFLTFLTIKSRNGQTETTTTETTKTNSMSMPSSVLDGNQDGPPDMAGGQAPPEIPAQ